MVVPGGDAREADPGIRIVCKIVLTEDERGQLVVWEWIVKGKCEFRILQVHPPFILRPGFNARIIRVAVDPFESRAVMIFAGPTEVFPAQPIFYGNDNDPLRCKTGSNFFK